jgi:hypothetical protein
LSRFFRSFGRWRQWPENKTEQSQDKNQSFHSSIKEDAGFS